MQRPTCEGLRVRSPADAHIIFHAVSLGLLPIVSRRLDAEERRAITTGCVFVWEERGPNTEATGLGIERWTDSIRWGPSRVRDEFLFYHEKQQAEVEMGSDSDAASLSRPNSSGSFYKEKLIKQTYSVFADTPKGRRKWHLIAYFTHGTLPSLCTIHDIPELASLHVPFGKYMSARSKPRPPRDAQVFDRCLLSEGPDGAMYPQTRYSPYPTNRSTFLRYHQTALSHSPVGIIKPSAKIEAGCRNRRSRASSGSRSPIEWEGLVPLSYLENIPPIRRHPLDEKALMSFTLTFR